MAKRLRWALLGLVGAVALVALGLTAFVFLVSRALPETSRTEEAEAQVDAMWAAVDVDAWERTGAVTWDFGGRQQHLWDRERGVSRVTWSDTVVLQHLDRRVGRAWVDGVEVEDDARDQLVERAWAAFANDSFWLAAPFKARDGGTSRGLASVDGEQGVLVSYASGGVTPGDAYMWLLDDDDRPRAWHMWVSIVPIGGEGTTWEGWTQLETGAWVATRHRFEHIPFELVLSDVRGAATLAELTGGEDPFAPLFAR